MESQVRRARLVQVQEELGVELVRERDEGEQKEAELEQVRSATVTIVRAD
jgi:hypothetical protein